MAQIPGICVAPQYVAEELLRGEGFTDVQYVKVGSGAMYKAFGAGEIDISMAFVAPFIMQVDAGHPLVLLAGVHVGCYELFGTDRVRAVSDLKGKTVAIPELGSPHHIFLASMASYVGLNPDRDINFVTAAAGGIDKAPGGEENRRIDGLSAGSAGDAGEENRPRGREQRDRPSLVAVLLLHGCRTC